VRNWGEADVRAEDKESNTDQSNIINLRRYGDSLPQDKNNKTKYRRREFFFTELNSVFVKINKAIPVTGRRPIGL
jgi:hypothetical protein